MVYISIVTRNRRAILERVLRSIADTTPEEHIVLVSDNGSTDDTALMLSEAVKAGLCQEATILTENLGSAHGRNAHWAHCIGQETVKLDDKVLLLAHGWLSSIRYLSQVNHAILGPPYDSRVQPLERIAPCMEWIDLQGDEAVGGPYLYLPAEVTEALGGWDELPGVVYGWDDVLYIQRARLLGWHYGYSLRTPAEYLAHASDAGRAEAARAHPLYEERLRQYREAERDLFISTGGN